MPVLTLVADIDPQGKCFTAYASIGRSSRCTFSIEDIKLSRVHCEIVKWQDDFILVDLNSQNGTILNGKLIREAILQSGDILSLGKSEVLFSVETENKQSPDLPEYKPIAIKKIGIQDVQ